MKCQILFSGEHKKNIDLLSSVAQRVVKVNYIKYIILFEKKILLLDLFYVMHLLNYR